MTIFPADPTDTFIPAFNHEGLIPPISEIDPTGSCRSPYHVTMYDLVCRFGTSASRCAILRGLVRLRHVLFRNSFTGFQWLDGSFAQNLMDREPHDIDVVNFLSHNLDAQTLEKIAIKDRLITYTGSKEKYFCDSYVVDISSNTDKANVVGQTAYWYSLFSHTRDRIWKGMLEIALPESRKEYDFYMALIDWRQAYEADKQTISGS